MALALYLVSKCQINKINKTSTLRLAALAFPTVDHRTREVLTIDHFLDAIEDPEFVQQIRDRQPQVSDLALNIIFFYCFFMLLFLRVCRECLLHIKINKIIIAVQIEVWANDTRMRRVESEPSMEIDQVQGIGEQSVSSCDCFEPNDGVLQEKVTGRGNRS